MIMKGAAVKNIILKAETGRFDVTAQDVALHLRRTLTRQGLKKLIAEHPFPAEPSSETEARPVKRKARQSVKRIKKEHKHPMTYVPEPSPGSLAHRIKREIDILVCTNDPKYAKLRAAIKSKRAEYTLVTGLATGIGEFFGLSATVVTPFVLPPLLMFIELGRNIYCSYKE
jgi:hypothetical protein